MKDKRRYSNLKKNDFSSKYTQSKKEGFITAENIPFKSCYQKEDIKNAEHISFLPGTPPYLGGPYASMYTSRPWTIRQYAGFSTAEESNAFYKRNLKEG
jgi:methylmalonyl-CoA mutase